jgi:diguanylate cyclase (GGDEF)-like protein
MVRPLVLEEVLPMFTGLDVIRRTSASELHGLRADLWILDEDVFGDAQTLLQVRRTLVGPAILCARADTLEAIQGELPLSDELCFPDTPLILLARLTRRLVAHISKATDTLTGLLSREAWFKQLNAALTAADAEHPVSVLILDIDYFKHINDQFGHSVGDAILQETAHRITALAPGGMAVGRLGGEEFALLVEADEEGALALAEHVREGIATASFAEGIRLTVSIGLVTVKRAENPQMVMRWADAALYAAKAQGRNRTIHHAVLVRELQGHDKDPELYAFENLTQVIAARVAEVITQRGRRLFRELRHEADIDGLTGLFNRRCLDRRLGWEVEEATRTDAPLSLALIDIDHFGHVNKEYGWPTGDRVLREVATLVREGSARLGWVARYGGEEICVVLPGVHLEEAHAVLEAIRIAIEQHCFNADNGCCVPITISAGVVERQDRVEEAATVLRRVSNRLLEAKRTGRNRVCS